MTLTKAGCLFSLGLVRDHPAYGGEPGLKLLLLVSSLAVKQWKNPCFSTAEINASAATC
jgi:hypothetical protein